MSDLLLCWRARKTPRTGMAHPCPHQKPVRPLPPAYTNPSCRPFLPKADISAFSSATPSGNATTFPPAGHLFRSPPFGTDARELRQAGCPSPPTPTPSTTTHRDRKGACHVHREKKERQVQPIKSRPSPLTDRSTNVQHPTYAAVRKGAGSPVWQTIFLPPPLC